MKKRRPVPIVVIALLQIVPILLLPPQLLRSINKLFLIIPVAVFALLAWALITLHAVGRMLTIFLQGLNIVVRLLVTMARVVPSRAPGTPADVPLLITSLIAIVLSVAILYYIDKPDLQLLFEA